MRFRKRAESLRYFVLKYTTNFAFMLRALLVYLISVRRRVDGFPSPRFVFLESICQVLTRLCHNMENKKRP